MMNKTFFNTALAFLLVAAGVSLLLVNLGILPLDMLEIWEYFYPLVFIALGSHWLLNGFAHYRRRRNLRPFGWFWGLTFLSLGLLLLLNKLEVIDFTLRQAWQLWPLLLIYLGINILGGRLRQARFDSRQDRGDFRNHHEDKGKFDNGHRFTRNTGGPFESGPQARESSRDYQEGQGEFRSGHRFSRDTGRQNIVRTLKFDQPNWHVEPLDLWHGVGDYRFDFSKAFIPEGDTCIRLSGWVGDIDILLPGDVAFSVTARANAGDLDVLGSRQEGINPYIHYKSTDYDEATRKLTFDFDFKVLDLQLDRV
jgi:lia operon protein LiaF